MAQIKKWTVSNIKDLTIKEMKGLLDEKGVSYFGFGGRRIKYEQAVIKHCKRANKKPTRSKSSKLSNKNSTRSKSSKSSNKKATRSKKHKHRKPKASLLRIDDDETFENEKERVAQFKKRSRKRQRKNTNNRNINDTSEDEDEDEDPSASDDRDETPDIIEYDEEQDILREYIDEFNDECVHQRCLFTKDDIRALNEADIMGHQLKTLLTNGNISLLLSLTDGKIRNSKLLELQLWEMKQLQIKGVDKKKEHATDKTEQEFKISFDSDNPDYSPFYTLYDGQKQNNENVIIIFPPIPKRIYYKTRYYIVLELLQMVNKFETLQDKKSKKKVKINQCYSGSGSNYFYRKWHFILILLDINAWDELMKDETNWMKTSVQNVKKKVLELGTSLTPLDKKQYAFTMCKEFMTSYNCLCGNIWKEVDKEDEKDKRMEIDSQNDSN